MITIFFDKNLVSDTRAAPDDYNLSPKLGRWYFLNKDLGSNVTASVPSGDVTNVTENGFLLFLSTCHICRIKQFMKIYL